MNKGTNQKLAEAKKNKNDEFYTQLRFIEKELQYYKDFFKDQVVFCNCDDPQLFDRFNDNNELKDIKKEAIKQKSKSLLKKFDQMFKEKYEDYEQRASQFWLYFHKKFKYFGLKKLIATHYDPNNENSYGMIYRGGGW